MSFFQFGFGLKYGWIFLLPYLFVVLFQLRFYPNRKAVMKRLTTMPPGKPFEKVIKGMNRFLYFATLLYSPFVPLTKNPVLFWVGTAFFAASVFCYGWAQHVYATTPENEPVTRGIYKISRNPIHFFSNVAWIGGALALGSWLILISNLIQIFGMHFHTKSEERFCLKKYGKSYEDYMKQVPRYFLFF